MAVNLDDVDDLINSISMNDASPAPPSGVPTPSGSTRTAQPQLAVAPQAAGPGDANTGFDLLESMMSQLESGRMSVAPGPLKASVIPKQAAAPTGVSMGPGASFGPGAAGRGISSGPGAAMGRGISSGPGAALAAKGKGVVSSGPGAAALAAKKKAEEESKIKMAEFSADGRKIIATGPPCAVCSQMILGRITNALGKQFHPECFKCKSCNQGFKDGGHIEHEDNAYCDPCYWNMFAPKCCRCSLPIKEKLITCINKNYHVEHFCCCGCGCPLAGKKYKEFEEDPYCLECFRLRERVINPAAHICAKCKKPIFGEYLNINGQKMHPEHYKCEACGRDFINGDCHEYDGKLYCEEDYRKLLKNVCFGCRKPIAGRSLTAMGRVWHPEHFVCAHCHEPFPNSNFFEHEGKPYCDLHYAQLFAQVCAKCERPVIGTALFALGKYWHQEHYICHYCDKLLSGNDTTVMEWEGKGMCRACYYKLPADVRKAYEKQKDAAKKAADRRMRDEKEEKKKQDKEERKAMKEAMGK